MSSLFQIFLKKLASFDDIDLDEYVPNLTSKKQTAWNEDLTPYLVIDGVFTPEYATEIREAFYRELANRGCTDGARNHEIFSIMHDYDGYVYTPPPDLTGPLRVFFSREWYDFLEKLSEKQFDENVITALHHHKKGSASGYVHNDYNVYAFRHNPLRNQLNHWKNNSIYQSVDGKVDITKQSNVILTRRYIAVIYYLDNEVWGEGDGGETGLFAHKKDTQPQIRIAPLYNRLLVLKIHARSWHAFMSNVARPRNTVIQWFHAPDVIQQ